MQWEVTMAEMLSSAGYATGMYGKWHLGRTPGRFPTDQGFDEWYGIPNSTDESTYASLDGFAQSGVKETYVLDAVKGQTPKQVRPYRLDYRPLIDRDLTDRAKSFIRKNAKANKPFFVYLPYTATHFPTMPHPVFRGKSGNGPWADLLMQIDSYTGELLDTLEELDIADNTIFIFTADNGPEAVRRDNTNLTTETIINGSSGPWRSTLFTSYEGALRVPFAIRWPNKIKPGRHSDEIVHAMDMLPTLATVAGAEVPQDRPIDGVDVSEFLTGDTNKSGREGFVVYMGDQIFAVKWRNWKLHFKEQSGWDGTLKTYTMPRVYNLFLDPQERNNVLFPHTWVPKAALGQLQEHIVSLKQHPPIPMGAKDPYSPPATK